MSHHLRRLFWTSCVAGMLFAGTSMAQETQNDASSEPTPTAEETTTSPEPASQVDQETASPEGETKAQAEGEASGSLELSLSAPKGLAASLSVPGRPNHEHFNMHFFGGVGFALGDKLSDRGYDSVGAFGGLGFDYVLTEPLAISIDAGMNGFGHESDTALRDLHLGAGVRVRLLADTNGPISQEGGNIAGNLWLDAHLNYHNYDRHHHAGFNVGVGYELALLKNFNFGPFARFQMTFAGDAPNYATMLAGLQISIGGQLTPHDKDKDGVEDENDKCPDEAEDKDGFEDEDGCPDNDNDKDGLEDEKDTCPIQAGPADNKGCPSTDDDKDGIENDFDKCPGEAEDKDGFEDEDGCPDNDNDGDAIEDAADKCPSEAEDKDGFEDEDGCPDNDNDGDAIEDAADKCPDEAEDKDGVEDEDGCPESKDEGESDGEDAEESAQ